MPSGPWRAYSITVLSAEWVLPPYKVLYHFAKDRKLNHSLISMGKKINPKASVMRSTCEYSSPEERAGSHRERVSLPNMARNPKGLY